MKKIDAYLLRAELRWRISRVGRKKCNLVGNCAIARSYMNQRNFFGKYHKWAHYAGASVPKSFCNFKWHLQQYRMDGEWP